MNNDHATQQSVYSDNQRQLINTLCIYTAIFSVPALLGSLSRVYTIGWQPILISQTIIAVSLLLHYFLRKHIHHKISAIYLLSVLMIVGLSGLLQFGAAAISLSYIIFGTLCSVILFSVRSALFILFITLITIALIATLKSFHMISSDIIQQDYHTNWSSWINLSTSYLFIGSCTLAIVNQLKGFYLVLLEQQRSALTQREVELNDANETLSETQIQLENLIAQLPGVAFRCSADINRHVIFTSQYARRWIDFTSDNSNSNVKSSINSFIHPEDRLDVHQRLNAFIESRSAIKLEYRVISKHNHEVFYVIERSVIHRNEDGKSLVMDGFIFDVTEMKKLEHNLRESEEKAQAANIAKSQFLATMSHEIRTPMNGILGLIQLLEDTQLNEEQSHYLSKLLFSSRTLLTILNDILDYSKIDANQMTLEHIPFSLRQSVSYIDSIIGQQCQEKGLFYSCTVDDNVYDWRIGDPTRLIQVLMNICSNAIKFTDEGSIKLNISQESTSANLDSLTPENSEIIIINIQDTGIGISQEAQEKLFQPFSQADAKINRRFGGTGLGLSICKKLMSLMNGDITLTSEPFSGTCFTLKLSLPFSSEGSVVNSQSPTSFEHCLKGKTILLAEDNLINQLVARKLIENTGGQVTVANDGEEAVALSRENTFDLILMDIQMPKMDGVDATKAIRSFDKQTPIIALTANTQPNEIQRYIQLGMNAYLSKPLEKELFFETLLQQLN